MSNISTSPPAARTDDASGAGELNEILKKYDIKEKVGKGSFGSIFIVYDKENTRSLVIKTVKKSKMANKRNAEREYLILHRLQQHPHRNIISIIALHDLTKYTCFLLELGGCNLADHLSNERSMNDPLETTIFIAKELLEAVSHLHRLGIVHRDLKLDNILYDKHSQTIKVIDFGSAEYFHVATSLSSSATGGGSSSSSSSTSPGPSSPRGPKGQQTGEAKNSFVEGLRGSPNYIPPEAFYSHLLSLGYFSEGKGNSTSGYESPGRLSPPMSPSPSSAAIASGNVIIDSVNGCVYTPTVVSGVYLESRAAVTSSSSKSSTSSTSSSLSGSGSWAASSSSSSVSPKQSPRDDKKDDKKFKYNGKVADVYGVGVVLFVIFFRAFPIDDFNGLEYYRSKGKELITKKKERKDLKSALSVYSPTKKTTEFFNSILHVNPLMRMTLALAQSHPFFAQTQIKKK